MSCVVVSMFYLCLYAVVVGTVHFIFCNAFFGGVGCSCVILRVCAARGCVHVCVMYTYAGYICLVVSGSVSAHVFHMCECGCGCECQLVCMCICICILC